MIEKLRIRNFQRHEKLDINIDTKVVAIVGPTDTGKSSVLRALRWVAMNRPMGMGFMRDGCDSVDVSVKVGGDTQIKRDRSKSKNTYRVKHNGKVSDFKAIGSDVPLKVENALNVGPENFQGQHDPPFWFMLSSSDVAKSLNKIVDLSTIDLVASSIGKSVRKQKVEGQVWQKLVQKSFADIDRYGYVEDIADDRDTLEDLSDTSEKAESFAKEMRILFRLADGAEIDRRNKAFVLEKAKVVVRLGNDAYEAEEKVDGLRDVTIRGRELAESISIDVPNIDRLIESYELCDRFKEDEGDLQEIVRRIKKQESMFLTKNAMLTTAESELVDELDGVCPICGGPFDG